MNLFTKYGIMASVGGAKNIIKDGIIQSGYSYVNSGASSYGTESNYFYVAMTSGAGGGYINIGDVTNFTKLKFTAKSTRNDIYNGLNFQNDEDVFSFSEYDARVVNLTTSFADYEIDITSFTGKSCVNLLANSTDAKTSFQNISLE